MRNGGRTLRPALCAALLLCALAAFPGPELQATIMRELSVEQLARLAPHVVRGTVLGQIARWTDDGKGILTYVDVAIHERVKGAGPLPAMIQIVEPGGELDGVRMRIVGGPVFRDGEELFLFLDRYSDDPSESDMTIMVGGAMGRMAVVRDPDGQSGPVVIRRFEGADFARFIEDKRGHRMEIGAPPAASALPIEEFRRRVTEAGEAPAPQGPARGQGRKGASR
jgi:hypothetical protein